MARNTVWWKLHSDGRGQASAVESGVDNRVVFELRTRASEGFCLARRDADGRVPVPLAIRFYGPIIATLHTKEPDSRDI